MFKHIAAAIVAAFSLCACATAPAARVPKIVSCNTTPQWYLYGNDGKPTTAVFICFTADGLLAYSARKLTAAEAEALATPKAQLAAITPKTKKPAAPAPKAAVKNPGAGATPASLPTLGGTAKASK